MHACKVTLSRVRNWVRRSQFAATAVTMKRRSDDSAFSAFSAEPDLQVQIAECIVEVHSQVLMIASAVWRNMLTNGMLEGVNGTVNLMDKDPEEFKLFYGMLHTSTVEPLTDQSAMVLSRWADEYQVEALKSICEDHLIKNVSHNSQAALLHAVHCNLPRRLRQCMDFMLSDLGNHINKLALFAVPGHEALMQEVWQAVCNKVCYGGHSRYLVPQGEQLRDKPIPPLDHVRSMWPFMVASLQASKWSARSADAVFVRPENWP